LQKGLAPCERFTPSGNEISLAMSAGPDPDALARVKQPYPMQSQAIKMAA
jgi:hypothetical protein